MSVADQTLAAMRDTNDLFCSTVVGRREFEALDRVYTTDAYLLPPGAELVQGILPIKSFWRSAIEGLEIKSATLATVSAEPAGDTVVEICRAELTLGSGQSVAIKYVVHWKLDGELWKWHTDIWNMNE